MTDRLIRREAAALGGKVYVLHTYSHGVRWMIVKSCAGITATRVRGEVVDHSHHFPARTHPSAGGGQTTPTPDEPGPG